MTLTDDQQSEALYLGYIEAHVVALQAKTGINREAALESIEAWITPEFKDFADWIAGSYHLALK